MTRAFKCDICGTLFEDAINDLNEISFRHRSVETGNIYQDFELTTCPSCMDLIITFINDHYKDENRKIKRNYN